MIQSLQKEVHFKSVLLRPTKTENAFVKKIDLWMGW
jgi:hypothetical protein